MKEESKKVGLKLNIQKAKNRIQSHPLWETEREKVETVTDFIFLGSKITVDGYCRNTFKRCLLLGRKADKPRQLIKLQRHHFADKGLYSPSYGFPNSHVQI